MYEEKLNINEMKWRNPKENKKEEKKIYTRQDQIPYHE